MEESMPKEAFLKLKPERQDEIRRVCLEEFAVRGYENASTNRIVEKLDIAKGTLFYYFTGKEELYHYLLQDAHTRISRAMAESLGSWPEDILERLRELTRAGLEICADMPQEYTLLSGMLDKEGNSLRDGILRELGGQSAEQFQALLAGADTSRLRYSAGQTALFLQWVYSGLKLELLQAVGSGEDLLRKKGLFMERLDTAIDMLRDGIYTSQEDEQ